MKRVKVRVGRDGYEVWVGSGLLQQVGQQLKEIGLGGKAVIITDRTVGNLYSGTLKQSLAGEGFEVAVLQVPAGEEQKSLETAGRLYDELSSFYAERTTPILALGGGVIGDLAGFVAATYMRGVPLIQMPTTLLAQGDSSIKVRLRMLTLYYFTNQLKYMVAGSSNRSELSIGYFTKYGDGGADILPLGNLVKGQVRELARFLGIPQQIIDKPPSAGLWQGQTDEDDLGFSYKELDHYLVTGEASNELREKIESMIAASNHKHSPPPVANLQD